MFRFWAFVIKRPRLGGFPHLDTFTWQIVTPAELSKRATRRRTKEALQHLSDTYYAKVEKHLTFINQNIVKSTSNDLLAKQEFSVTAKNLPITTLKTSCVYFLLTIHKPNNQGWPNVSACSCPPNLFPAIQTKLWHLSSTLYLFTLRTGICTWNYSWF